MIRGLRWAALLLCALLPACGPRGARAAPLKVVASIAPLADWSRQVGGARVQVTQLVPAGQDPRSHTLSDAERAAVQAADVVLLNGLGLEPWLDEQLSERPNTRTVVVEVADYVRAEITALPAQAQLPQSSALREGGEGDDRAEPAPLPRQRFSPYLWLSPASARQIVTLIAQSFARADLAGWPGYRQQAALVNAEIENLDHRLQRMLDQLPRSTVDDLDSFLLPYTQHFHWQTDTPAVALLARPTVVAVDALLPPEQQLALLGTRRASVRLNPLGQDSYLVLIQTLTDQFVQGQK